MYSGASSGKTYNSNGELYSSGTALRLAAKNARSNSGQIMALEAMYENGNITKKQYTDLVYALKNPGK